MPHPLSQGGLNVFLRALHRRGKKAAIYSIRLCFPVSLAPSLPYPAGQGMVLCVSPEQ